LGVTFLGGVIKMLAKIFKFLKESKGAALIEYALIASLIAIAAIAAMTGLGGHIKNKFNHIQTKMENE
jgi:pilus assembly protein Flp/PilA